MNFTKLNHSHIECKYAVPAQSNKSKSDPRCGQQPANITSNGRIQCGRMGLNGMSFMFWAMLFNPYKPCVLFMGHRQTETKNAASHLGLFYLLF